MPDYKLYQTVWAYAPDATPALGVITGISSQHCKVRIPEGPNTYAVMVARLDELAPATAAEIEAAPDWVRAMIQQQVTQTECCKPN